MMVNKNLSIKNGKNGKIVFIRGNAIHLHCVKHARTFEERFLGLMGVEPADFNYALVFHLAQKGKMSASIHMLFMKMPIDVLFLDENKKIVDMVECLKPWTWNYTPKKPAKYVAELPEHTLNGKIKPGMSVGW